MTPRKLTHYVTARDGTRLAYHIHLDRDAGDEAALARRPTLLLSNGVGTSENFWKHLVHAFAGDFRVVHWDYRGHGESERALGGDYAIRTHADDLLRVTEAVIARGDGHTAPVHVGFSMGVAVVLEGYQVRPDLFTAMVLLAGAAGAPYLSRLPGAQTAVNLLFAAATPLLPVAVPLVRRLFRSPLAYPLARALGVLQPQAPREDIDMLFRGLVAMDPLAFWHSVRGLMATRGTKALRRVTVPTLVVAAEHDRFVPRYDMRALHAGIAGSRYVLVEDAGHANLLEAGPEVAAQIRLFLRTLE
jgi:pimeloyl-ACP methyl ester carboxylesterase